MGFLVTLVTGGLLILFGSSPLAETFGRALLFIGVCGLAWQAWRLQAIWQAEQGMKARDAERTARREARRLREQKEREQRRAQRQAQALNEARQEERRAAQRRVEQERAAQESVRRAAQDDEIEAETTRLLALTDAQLLSEAYSLFALQGLTPQPAAADAECDLRLITSASRLEAARCVPVARQATGVDVDAVESWRQEIGAQRAYLIALHGFTPEALRRAKNVPITLVEAHLLAHWKCTARGREGERGLNDARHH